MERETFKKVYQRDLVIHWMWGWGWDVKENQLKITPRFLVWGTGWMLTPVRELEGCREVAIQRG